MATIQKIRSKGPLLLIVIGLAMLAFILGDAWKILRPNQGIQYVGTIDGKNISAMDFQKEVDNYTEVIKFANQTNNLTDEQVSAVRDEAWALMVRNNILNKQAQALGLTVTDAEVRDVIERGTDPILANTPFSNTDGEFDADMLKSFLAFYTSVDPQSIDPNEWDQYQSMYRYWLFVESDIKSGLLYSKYLGLVKAALVSNPVAAKNSFDNRINRFDILMAYMPYSSVSDADVKVSTSDLKKTYADNKELLRNYSESRDIYYIDYEIEPSDADRQALLEEVTDLTDQIESLESDYASFVRRAGSEIAYSEVPRSARNLPEDVAERLDSVNNAGVFGPYYSAYDDTYNTFKVISTSTGYDSIQFAMIQVVAADEQEMDQRADSIMNAAKKGADFAALAQAYGQSAQESWMSADSYEPATISGDNALYINKVNSMKKGEVSVLKLDGVDLVIKVVDTKTPLTKYNVALVKRVVEFSEETSNAAYNKLSMFVAQNATLTELKANAEDSDFRLLYYPGFESYSYNIAGVSKSHEALRWAFDAQEDEVSRIFEVGQANDHLLVVGVDKIHESGYRSIEDATATLSLRAINDKKFELINAKFAGQSISDLKGIEGVVIDTVKFANFNNAAYVNSSASNEETVGPSVSRLAQGGVTVPMKGENCVYVAQKLTEDQISAEFDVKSEQTRLQTIATTQIPGGVLEALYYSANVVDKRYKVF